MAAKRCRHAAKLGRVCKAVGLPENWGLLELKSPTGRIAVTRVALPQKHNQSAELGAMFQAMSCLTWNSEIALDRIRAGVSVGDECESVQFRPDEL
jgi:hypothetical protein